MRTTEQIYEKYKRFLSAVSKGEALNAIRLIQEEAYNQALKDAVDNVEFEIDGQEHIERVWIDNQSILKLKK